MYGVLCGDVSWTGSPTYIWTFYIFNNFKLSNFNKETTSSLKMMQIEIETCWSVLSVFKCFNINFID
jgi:hypothetical protein